MTRHFFGMCFVALAGMNAVDGQPSGNRMEDYRGPTPETLAGAGVVQAEVLWKPSAIFVNVVLVIYY
jgi:hypothetical protein